MQRQAAYRRRFFAEYTPTCFTSIQWPCSPCRALASSLGFRNSSFFYGVGLLAPRPTPNLEDQVSVFMTPRRQGKVAQLYPRALGSSSRGSSGSIVSDYGLDDRAIEVRSLTGAEDFSSSPCDQNGSGGPPSLLSSGYRGFFPRR
jgi:hypothetical protein